MGQLHRGIGALVTLQGAAKKGARGTQVEDLAIQKKAALWVDSGCIRWLGPEKKIPRELAREKGIKEIDHQGGDLIPGLVECHTHSVFAGSRAEEFELRLQGSSYQEIHRRGGGIGSTMAATRKATREELESLAQKRVDRFLRQGVTTLEIKSGYGLNTASELKMLRAARALKGPRIRTSFLGPHSLPPEFSSAKEYVEHLSSKTLPRVAREKLADAVDIFIEKGFFGLEEGRSWAEKAQAMGLPLRMHAEQLSHSGGTQLAMEMKALSADHLVEASDKDIRDLAKSEVTAVLLPTADFYLRLKYPRARQMLDQGARVALASDFNPGSAPSQDISLVGMLARLEMKMSLPEVLVAYTLGAAYALGLEQQVGSIELGKRADFVILEGSWQECFYEVGHFPAKEVYVGGKRKARTSTF